MLNCSWSGLGGERFVCQSFFFFWSVIYAKMNVLSLFSHPCYFKLITFVFCRLLRVIFLHLKADNDHCLYLKSCIVEFVKFVSINSKQR